MELCVLNYGVSLHIPTFHIRRFVKVGGPMNNLLENVRKRRTKSLVILTANQMNPKKHVCSSGPRSWSLVLLLEKTPIEQWIFICRFECSHRGAVADKFNPPI